MRSIGSLIDEISRQRHLGQKPEQTARKALADPSVQRFLKEHKDQVNNKMVAHSLTSIFEFVTQLHSPDHVMKGYEPELFINGSVIDIRYRKTAAQQRREKKAALRNNLALIDLPERLHNVRLSDIDKESGRKKALAEIALFLKRFSKNTHQQGLYLSGDFGVGKTYILAGLANAVASAGKKVIFLHVPTFIASLSSHFEDNSLQREVDQVSGCDLLILDDIGAETLSQWSRDDVLGVILQRRMDNVLPTFFSSNLDMKKLQEHFATTRNAVDPVKAARLMQRVRFLAREVVVSGPNRRNM